MFACPCCADLYLTQREADLCTPRERWIERYGIDTADPFHYLRSSDMSTSARLTLTEAEAEYDTTYDVCANQSTCPIHDEGIECDMPADHDGGCDFTGCPCDLQPPISHVPGAWIVVCGSPLIVSAMCVCGNAECAYTATVYDAVNTHLEPFATVKV